jgi:hypothetical protein
MYIYRMACSFCDCLIMQSKMHCYTRDTKLDQWYENAKKKLGAFKKFEIFLLKNLCSICNMKRKEERLSLLL